MDSSLPASMSSNRLATGAIASLYSVFIGELPRTMMVQSHAVASSGTAASRARRLLRLFRVGLTCCPSVDGSLAVAGKLVSTKLISRSQLRNAVDQIDSDY